MSPKGGIRPHNRFSVQSKRSEVLFVDYMAEHLTPRGRAAIIVPEGIIFQSQNAHRQLRKMLVENYLVAVISLPAGVFKPYSGVKTSILILDRALARKSNHVAFFKVENDGFDLGDQRRKITNNDLPKVKAEIAEYLERLRAGEPVGGSEPAPTDQVSESGADYTPTLGLIAGKEKIAEDGEYNLSGERYRERRVINSKFGMVALGEICEIRKGTAITRKEVVPGSIPVIAGGQSPSTFHNKANRTGETITVSASGAYAGFVNYFDVPIFASDCSTIKPVQESLLSKFVFHILKARQSAIYDLQVGMGQPHVYPKDLAAFEIPLPPPEIQQKIVAEIEGYQRVIDGARAVIDNYQPQIVIDPEWPIVKLEECCENILSGGTPSTKNEEYWKGDIPWITSADIVNIKTAKPRKHITKEAIKKSATNLIPKDNLIVVTRVGLGKLFRNDFDVCISQDSQGLIVKNIVNSKYLVYVLKDKVTNFKKISQGSTIQGVTKSQLAEIETPLPSMEVQQSIVAEIETEEVLVAANHELINRFEKKIQSAVERVWGKAAID